MRLTKDNYFIEIAKTVAKRSTCIRRAVGCVLVDHRGNVLATGYNGVASGLPHCNEAPPHYPFACTGAFAKSGEDLHKCDAIHAEENALIQCKDIDDIDTCYTTVSPCIFCVRKLLNTSCKTIKFEQEYPHPESKELWESQGRVWEKI